VSAKQTLNIKILSCGGMVDLMSEQEATFLNSSLGLFRNVQEQGRATPRANASMVRAYRPAHFYSALTMGDDLLHLIAHANATTLQVGAGSKITAAKLEVRAGKGLRMPQVVVSTACKFDGPAWHQCLRALGVQVLIAARDSVTPANLASFDMAFYSALLARIRKGMTIVERVEESFKLADRHYRDIHAPGTPFAKFSLIHL